MVSLVGSVNSRLATLRVLRLIGIDADEMGQRTA